MPSSSLSNPFSKRINFRRNLILALLAVYLPRNVSRSSHLRSQLENWGNTRQQFDEQWLKETQLYIPR